jgi:flagellar basal body-associated protein FliL
VAELEKVVGLLTIMINHMATKKTTKTSKDKGLSQNQVIGIGVGITAAVAAAAGGFFLYGSKNAAKNRKAVKSWALKAKAEVLEGIEKAKDMSQEEYEQLVDTVVGTYITAKSASKNELGEFKKEMKDHWQGLVKTAVPKKSATKKAATKKTVAKKTVSKKK